MVEVEVKPVPNEVVAAEDETTDSRAEDMEISRKITPIVSRLRYLRPEYSNYCTVELINQDA